MSALEQPHEEPGLEHIQITYDQVASDTRLALGKLLANGRTNFDTVLGIPRGGLFPAQVAACDLGIRRVSVMAIQSYDGATQLDTGTFLTMPDFDTIDGQDVLVVDDIYDTGRTIDFIKRELGERAASLTILTTYCKPDKNQFPGQHADAVGRIFAADTWLDFPWDGAERGEI